MQIADSQTNSDALADLGAEAADLLRASDFHALAVRFGYALALGRDPAQAIREDLVSALSRLQATGLDPTRRHTASVQYFQPNDSGLVAVVECSVPVSGGNALLLELVVTAQGADKHLTLEQLSVAA